MSKDIPAKKNEQNIARIYVRNKIDAEIFFVFMDTKKKSIQWNQFLFFTNLENIITRRKF